MDPLENLTFKMIDPITIRVILALGAVRTSPSGVIAGANEPSLFNRRLKLSMQYVLKNRIPPIQPMKSLNYNIKHYLGISRI